MARASDILVVGAGIVGCAVAYELARRGASVALVDERSAGAGATQASGGMLAPYSEAAEGSASLLDLGARSLALFDDFVAALEADSGLSAGYVRSGTLHVARDHESLDGLRTIHDVLSARGVRSELLTADGTRACEPHLTADLVGGLLIPGQALVSALEMARALAGAAVHRGAHLHEPARVLRIARAGSGVAVETNRGTLTARTVVVAAGAWSGTVVVEGAAAVPVRPIRGQLLHLGWCGAPVARVTWDERCYVVPRHDRSVLVGATVEDVGFDERTTVGGVRTLLEAACGLLPQAASATLIAARVGFRPGSPDPMPIVGWSDAVPGVMYATGHFRNGVLLAPVTAAIVADAILLDVRDAALTLTSPSRFGRL